MFYGAKTENKHIKCSQNDEFVVVSNANKRCKVAVKTGWGELTERFELEDIEMQGTVLAPLKCSIQINSFGKDFLEDEESGKILYKYKTIVKISPLGMIDDLLTITHCSSDSVKMSSAVQSKINNKRLKFGEEKCIKIHIGNEKFTCPQLQVHEKIMPASKQGNELQKVGTSTIYLSKELCGDRRR